MSNQRRSTAGDGPIADMKNNLRQAKGAGPRTWPAGTRRAVNYGRAHRSARGIPLGDFNTLPAAKPPTFGSSVQIDIVRKMVLMIAAVIGAKEKEVCLVELLHKGLPQTHSS